MDLEQSLETIVEGRGERFAARFYRSLFQTWPELERFFTETDMWQQGVILTMALRVLVEHYDRPKQATDEYLRVLGDRHADRGIAKQDYDKFSTVLLDTLADFHAADWDEPLAADWKGAIEGAITVMLEGTTSDRS